MMDGSEWSAPATPVIEAMCSHYDCYPHEINDEEILDWAQNNMNWEDFDPIQIKVPEPPDYSVQFLTCDIELEKVNNEN